MDYDIARCDALRLGRDGNRHGIDDDGFIVCRAQC